MKLKAEFSILERSVDERPVKDLISRLKKVGIDIDQSDSEKKVEYITGVDSVPRKSRVPLNTRFDEQSDITGYFLRGNNLKLTLKDYDDRYPNRPDTIGGGMQGDYGVNCIVKFEGSGNYTEVLEKIERVVKDFYYSGSKRTGPTLADLKMKI